jgi:hypothetical protein
MSMIVFLYLCIKPEHHPQTRPAISWKFLVESLQPLPVALFLKPSIAGVLSLSECGSGKSIASTSDLLALFHFESIRLITLVISIGLTVRMGNLLAANVPHAKKIATS